MVGKKTSLRLPSTSVYQSLLLGPGAAPNAILRPGPHIGGAPGPPGASIGEEVWKRLTADRIEPLRRLTGRWLSGRKHPPAKRGGGVKLPREVESLPSRHLRGQESRRAACRDS